MEVLFAGALSKTLGIPEALRAAAGIEGLPFGILRVTSADAAVNGKLVVADGRFIVGAVLSDQALSGYAAARRLLAVSDGTFAYLNAGLRPPAEYDQTMCLSLAKVAECWPRLPDSPEQLFDEQSLLDKIFGYQPDAPTEAPVLPVLTAHPPAPSDVAKSTGAPLLGMRQEGPIALPGFDFEDTLTARVSLNKLREQEAAESHPWYSQLVKEALSTGRVPLLMALVVLVLFIAAVALYFAITQNNSPKQHNSLTIQRGALPHHQP